jgi:serine-type D-Ala-D-Ala carboxypeptidase/endopeptidase
MTMLKAFGLALAALPVCAAPAQSLEQLYPRLDAVMAEYQASAPMPGLVYGIVRDGKLVHVRGFGVQELETKRPVTADSLFRIASMSKAFTALAILKLRDQRKLRLDDPAELYVPELRAWKYPTGDSPRIRVRDLLTHTAGFVEDNPWGDRQQPLPEPDFTTMLKAGVPFAQAPGLRYEYSNFGYATLGRIIGNVSGESYQRYVTRNFLAPLGMRSTGYDISASPRDRRAIGYRWQNNQWLREPDMADGAFGAMGGVQTSANDYAKWVAFLLSAWPARDGADAAPVKRATVRQIVEGVNMPSGTMRNPAYGGTPCRQAVTYGMGWRVIDDCDLGRVVTHTGGYPGYGSVVLLLPDKGVGLFAFGSRTYNGASPAAWRALLAMQAAGVLKDREIPVSPGLAQAYAAAREVWRKGDVTAAPLAMNMLMDRDAGRWRADLARLKSEIGDCAGTEAIAPISAMEGHFTWRCERGTIKGRVQRAPTPAVTIQALNFEVGQP